MDGETFRSPIPHIMYKYGKVKFKHKKDFESYLLQSAIHTLEYLKQRCPDETDVIETVENDLNKILALNKSPLKKLG